MILVSACLLGCACRYDGQSKPNPLAQELARRGLAVPVCPEQLGGLPTPRKPDEIRSGRVYEKSGKENTEEFIRGAEETLRIAKLLKADMAVLKQNSPSCGSAMIYDGTFSGKKIPGSGITASLLIKNGIRVISEEEIAELRELFKQP